MDKPDQLDGGAQELTLQQLMEELIAQKLRCWRARQEKIPDGRLAEQLVAMCWNGEGNLLKGPGCLLPDHKGGYVYVPYDEGEDLSPELQASHERLEKAMKDKANAGILRRMDKALEREVNEKCFWEFVGDGADAARIDFHGKINILAKYRLIQRGVDVSPSDPPFPQFRFGVTAISEFGVVHMQWRSLDWGCHESEVVQTLTAFFQPKFTAESVLRRQLADLATVKHPADVAREARVLEEELKARQQPAADDQDWRYILCAADQPRVPADERAWSTLRRSPNDIKLVKRMSREQKKWPIIILRWQLRHYNLSFQISCLQKKQTAYLVKLEEAKAQQRSAEGAGEAAGAQYFSQGAVSSLDIAWQSMPAVFGTDGDIAGNGGGLGAAAAAEVVA